MRTLGSLSPGGSIALGIVVGVLSTSVQSLGLTLQRKSHILEDEKAPHVARRPPHRRRRWQIGMGMFLVANLLGSSVQISTLPLPVLSTLQASGLVFNSICATLILGEPFTRWSLWGTLLVCSGAVLIAIFGAIPAPAHNLHELLALLARPTFVAWMSLQGVVVVALAVCVELASTFLFAALAQTSRFRLARGLAYGCISGILSAHSLLVAKSAVELVVRTIADGKNQFRHWQAWALVLVFVALALTQLYYLHRGLKLVSTSVLYPLVFCVYNIIAILDGLIYFRQTDMISPLRACLISLGTAILLSGVFALSWRLSDEQHPPNVGQSTLAPGLALVENAEGGTEEEQESLLLASEVIIEDLDDEERETGLSRAAATLDEGGAERRSLLPRKFVSSYHTFTFGSPRANGDAVPTADAAAGVDGESALTSPTAGRRKTAASSSFSISGRSTSPTLTPARWTERAEIWGELEDQTGRRRGSVQLAGHRRHRSSTLPTTHNDMAPQPLAMSRSPLAGAGARAGRRGVSTGSPAAAAAAVGSSSSSPGDDTDADADTVVLYQKAFQQQRRQTTGFFFPGFRRNSQQASSGTGGTGTGGNQRQETLGGVWRLGWWGGRNKGKKRARTDTNTNTNTNTNTDTDTEQAAGLSEQRPSDPSAAQQPLHLPPPSTADASSRPRPRPTS